MRKITWILGLLLAVGGGFAFAADGSGLHQGDRLQPFTSNVVTGDFRGQQHCYVCSLVDDKPAVLVFARHMTPAVARLVHNLNSVALAHQSQHFFSWVVFLGPRGTENEVALEDKVEKFADQNRVPLVPLSALGEPTGPPGYQLSEKADVIVIMTEGRKTIATQTFDSRQWSDKAADGVVAAIQTNLHLK